MVNNSYLLRLLEARSSHDTIYEFIIGCLWFFTLEITKYFIYNYRVFLWFHYFYNKLFCCSVGLKVNDGKWHQVTVISNGSNTYISLVGQSIVGNMNVLGGSWLHFVKNDPVIVGTSKNQAPSFKGCLRNVKVGGWLLPFVEFYNKTINISNMIPMEPRFRGDPSKLRVGCYGDNVCSPDPCIYGSCSDTWNDYQCIFRTGCAGLFCDLGIHI